MTKNYCNIIYIHIFNTNIISAKALYLDSAHKFAPITINIFIFSLYIYYHASTTQINDEHQTMQPKLLQSIEQNKCASYVKHLFILLHTTLIISNYIRVSNILLKQRRCETFNTFSMPNLFHFLSSLLTISLSSWFIEPLFLLYYSVFLSNESQSI